MENSERLTAEQIRAFLKGSAEVEFRAKEQKQAYEWTQQTPPKIPG